MPLYASAQRGPALQCLRFVLLFLAVSRLFFLRPMLCASMPRHCSVFLCLFKATLPDAVPLLIFASPLLSSPLLFHCSASQCRAIATSRYPMPRRFCAPHCTASAMLPGAVPRRGSLSGAELFQCSATQRFSPAMRFFSTALPFAAFPLRRSPVLFLRLAGQLFASARHFRPSLCHPSPPHFLPVPRPPPGWSRKGPRPLLAARKGFVGENRCGTVFPCAALLFRRFLFRC